MKHQSLWNSCSFSGDCSHEKVLGSKDPTLPSCTELFKFFSSAFVQFSKCRYYARWKLTENTAFSPLSPVKMQSALFYIRQICHLPPFLNFLSVAACRHFYTPRKSQRRKLSILHNQILWLIPPTTDILQTLTPH